LQTWILILILQSLWRRRWTYKTCIILNRFDRKCTLWCGVIAWIIFSLSLRNILTNTLESLGLTLHCYVSWRSDRWLQRISCGSLIRRLNCRRKNLCLLSISRLLNLKGYLKIKKFTYSRAYIALIKWFYRASRSGLISWKCRVVSWGSLFVVVRRIIARKCTITHQRSTINYLTCVVRDRRDHWIHISYSVLIKWRINDCFFYVSFVAPKISLTFVW